MLYQFIYGLVLEIGYFDSFQLSELIELTSGAIVAIPIDCDREFSKFQQSIQFDNNVVTNFVYTYDAGLELDVMDEYPSTEYSINVNNVNVGYNDLNDTQRILQAIVDLQY